MTLNSRFRLPLLLTAIALLSACDSGSGDEVDKPTGLEMEPGDYAGQRASATDLEELESITEIEGVVRDAEDFMLVLMDRLDAAWAGSAEDNPEECYEGNDNFEVVYESQENVNFAFYEMSDCIVPGYGESARLNGTIALRTETAEEVDASLTLVSYNISGLRGGRTLDLFGTRGTEVYTQAESDSLTVVRTAQMEYELANRYIALWNYRSAAREDGELFGRVVEGTLVDSEIDGFVQVKTRVPVEWDDGEGCPDRGHLTYKGVGTLEIRYGENSGNGQGQEWLANGSDVEYLDSCDNILGEAR